MFSLTFQGKSYLELHENIKVYMQDMGCELPPKETAKLSSIHTTVVTSSPALPEVPAIKKVVEPKELHQHKSKQTEGHYDSNGTPWDPRIHTLKKSVDKNGEWKLARGIDPMVVRKVMAELEEKGLTKPATIDLSEPLVPELTPPASIAETIKAAIETVEPVKEVVAPPLPPLAQPGKYAHTFESFRANLVVTMASLVNDGKITQEYITKLNDYFGVKEIWEIFETPEKVKELYTNFCEAGLLEKVV